MGIFDNIKKKTSEFTSQFGEKNANTKSSSSDFLSPELSMLIDSAIIDGEITDTSRETLHKRAMREGSEPDELDLIINSRIAKSKPTQTPPTQQQQPPAPPAMPKMHSNKHGEIKKCPNCGEPIAAFSVHCEMCGHEFTNVEASTNISILFEKLQELDNQQSQQLIQRGKTGRVFGSITRSLTSIDLDSPIKEDFLNKKINIIKTFLDLSPGDARHGELLQLLPEKIQLFSSLTADYFFCLFRDKAALSGHRLQNARCLQLTVRFLNGVRIYSEFHRKRAYGRNLFQRPENAGQHEALRLPDQLLVYRCSV